MRRALLAAVLLCGGCALPLPGGVHDASGVVAGQGTQGDVVVVPPGPARGAGPTAIVRQFLLAQSDPDGRHAIAREFLAGGVRWNDADGATVYDAASLAVRVHDLQLGKDADEVTVTVSATPLATLTRGGSYTPGGRTADDDYLLVRPHGHEWRIASLPSGLRLGEDDFRRAFTALDVDFLELAPEGITRLVPDRVYLAPDTTAVMAAAAVRRLAAGPASTVLIGTTANRVAGATVRAVDLDDDGVVTVDLAGPPASLTGPQRVQLAQQLVWTLKGVSSSLTGLRVELDGRPYVVPDQGSVVSLRAYDDLVPDGVAPEAPLYDLVAGHVQVTVGPPAAGPGGGAPATDRVTATSVAVATDRTRVALVDGRTVHLGALRSTSPLSSTEAAAPLSSPSWGAGDHGVWMVEGSRTLVVLQPGRGLRAVPVARLPAGQVTGLSVSRDGARIALAVGGQLLVGGITQDLGVVALTPIAPSLQSVRDVAWESATTLVALAGTNGGPDLPYRVAVDGSAVNGSAVESLAGPVSGATLTRITASPDGVAVGGTVGGAPVVYRLDGRTLAQRTTGSAPAYPG